MTSACSFDGSAGFVSAGGGVARGFQQVDDALAEVALDDNLALLGRASYATACLEPAGKGSEVVIGAYETTHQGYCLSTTVGSLYADTQLLRRWREGGGVGVIGLALIGVVGIGGEYDSETVFPVVHGYGALLFWTQRN